MKDRKRKGGEQMEVKSRKKAEHERIRRESVGSKKAKLQPCPFCGNAVFTSVSTNGVRFFDCGGCGAKVSFTYGDEEESIELWNTRV